MTLYAELQMTFHRVIHKVALGKIIPLREPFLTHFPSGCRSAIIFLWTDWDRYSCLSVQVTFFQFGLLIGSVFQKDLSFSDPISMDLQWQLHKRRARSCLQIENSFKSNSFHGTVPFQPVQKLECLFWNGGIGIVRSWTK